MRCTSSQLTNMNGEALDRGFFSSRSATHDAGGSG